jgi:uncharacterized membrane protein YeiH
MTFFLVCEWLGTAAFAVSGAMVAIDTGMDLFGVIFLAMITALGGGTLRDVLIGHFPPRMFTNFEFLLLAVACAVTVFVLADLYKERYIKSEHGIERVNNVFDAIGLASFSVSGTEIAFQCGVSDNFVLAILLGLLTGVGGGVLRDVLTSNTPYIFKKHVYALASIAGATAYYLLRLFVTETWLPSLLSMVLVVGVRLLASHYRWSLPKAHLE